MYIEQLNECLKAIKNGDQTKYYELHQITYGPFINIAKQYLIDKSEAENVVSDVYKRIFNYADRYDTSRDAQAYLWQIIKHKAYDYNKKFLRNNTVNIDDFPIADSIDLFERIDTKMDVERALKRVGKINAFIVMMKYKYEFTQEEIGEKLNMSKSAVCQRLTKTKKKLYEILKQR